MLFGPKVFNKHNASNRNSQYLLKTFGPESMLVVLKKNKFWLKKHLSD